MNVDLTLAQVGTESSKAGFILAIVTTSYTAITNKL